MHRHTDSETGVGRWWKPFDVSYEFKYVGLNQRSSRRMASMPSCGVLPHADCTLSAEPGRSYELFFRHHAAGFFCITLLSSVLWGRGELLHCALTWTLLTALASGLLAGLFIRGSQTLQLMLVSGEILLSLLFLRAWWPRRVCATYGNGSSYLRRPSLGSGSQSWRINLHPRAEYRLLLNLTALALALRCCVWPRCCALCCCGG
jgi:hypothetical protein